MIILYDISGCKTKRRRNTRLVFRKTGGYIMKKACIITLICVLTATLFAGCRNMGNTTTTTTKPGTSSSSRPTVVPMPEIPLPSGTNTTSPAVPAPLAAPVFPAGVPHRVALKCPTERLVPLQEALVTNLLRGGTTIWA